MPPCPLLLRGAAAGLAVAALTAPLPAQATQQHHLFTFQASKDGEALGWAVACGDVDRDGFDEVVLGAPWADDKGNDSGYLLVMTGLSGGLRLRATGDAAEDWFGAAVVVAGDADGDGHRDILVGAPQPQSAKGPGYARLLSGKDGKVLWTWPGDAALDRSGWAVAGIGDVDQDGSADLAVGAPFADTGAPDAGLVRVFSGKTGKPLWQRAGPSAGDAIGWSLAAVGDADGDGWPDLLCGSRRSNQTPGFVLLLSGKDGAVLRRHDGVMADDRFGCCVAAASDIDRDGRPDYAVLAARGDVRVFSGRDGTQKLAWTVPARPETATTCLVAAGDVDGDGWPDLAAGTPLGGFPTTGVVRVHSGRDASVLQAFWGSQQGIDHGWSVASGDVNGDGQPDLVMGEPRSIATGGGWGRVASSKPLLLSADGHELSLGATSGPRQQGWTLDAGPAHAGQPYLMMGTVSGTKPGVPLGPGVHLPINPDAWTDLTLIFANGPMLASTFGLLDAQGKAAGSFRLVSGLPAWLAGTTFWHAYAAFLPGRWQVASNAVPVTLLK